MPDRDPSSGAHAKRKETINNIKNDVDLQMLVEQIPPADLSEGQVFIETPSDFRTDAHYDEDAHEADPKTFKFYIVRFRFDPQRLTTGSIRYQNELVVGTYDTMEEAARVHNKFEALAKDRFAQ